LNEQPKVAPETGLIVVRSGSFAPDEYPIVRQMLESASVGEVARRTGRNKSTVSRLAKAEGWSIDRAAQTLPARQARASDLAVKRLNLAALAAEKLEVILNALTAPRTFRRVNTRTGEIIAIRETSPDPAAIRDLAVAAGILFDKVHVAIGGESPTSSKNAILELVQRIRVNVENEDAS
jgi:hypothetical protein